MLRYFIAGNVWLIVALIVFLGRSHARSQPTLYCFFGVGRWMYPSSYSLVMLLCVGLGVAFLILAVRSARRSA